MARGLCGAVLLGTLTVVLIMLVAVTHGTAATGREVDRIYTIAGHGGRGFFGTLETRDGSYATDVQVDAGDVAMTPDGSILFADRIRDSIRRIGLDGRLSTVTRVGGAAVEVLPGGELLVADSQQVYRGPNHGPMKLIGGRSGDFASDGDGGPAVKAGFDYIQSIAQEAGGGVLVLEMHGNRIRRIRTDGIVETAAGTGQGGFSGDGGAATSARLNVFDAGDIAVLPGGGFLIADGTNNRVRKVGADGVITTVAGDGRRRSRGDGGRATAASIDFPTAVAVTPDGGFLVTDAASRIRRVDRDGIISTVVGTGTYEPESPGTPVGDGGTATRALISLNGGGLALTPNGFVFTDVARIRLVTSGVAAHPAVAVTGIRRRSHGRLVVRFRTTLGGSVRATSRTENGRRAGEGTAAVAAAGPGTVSSRRAVSPGVYWVTVTVRGAGHARARTNVGIVVAARLTESVARTAAAYAAADAPEAFGYGTQLGACRRMSRHRIDCVGLRIFIGDPECMSMVAVTLRAGFTYGRLYGCGRGSHAKRFVRRPRWTGPSIPQAVVNTEPRGRR